ncbi:MAG: protein-arginine deiminase domain-containing protein [Rhodospirillales bacterium]|nr:protein-arginine deiminase domain-containing protein [Rhodospirillales bacterium]
MSSRSERFDANAAIFFSGCCCCCIPIRNPQFLDVRVRANGPGTQAIGAVQITVTPMGGGGAIVRNTDNAGDVIFRLPVDHYDVRAQKAWHAPDDIVAANQNLAQRSSTIVRFNMQPLQFHLHVDADRNGVVDNQTEADINQAAPAWAWGAGNRGAILPVNVDDDDVNNVGDFADNIINGINDANSDIARIEVHRVGGAAAVPVAWDATLEINSPAGELNPQNNARIFVGIAAGDAQLVGTGAQQAALPAWPVNIDTYGMEATRYAGAGFNGVISVRLTVNCPDPLGGVNLSYFTEAQMRAASWLMPNHLDQSDTVYVTRIGGDADSTAFINALTPLIDRPENQGGAGSHLDPQAYNDQWMQDCMEIGYSTWPGTGGGALRMESVMRALRGRALRNMPGTLRGVNFGYTFPGLGGASQTFDSTGNLEVTPSADATNAAANGAGPKNYAWGRIYYGRGRPLEPFNAETQSFLEAQSVQKPIALNTDWLAVGHVDEMMTFIPTPGGNKEWKLLIASPTRAYAILGQVNGGLNGGNGGTPVMQRLANALQLSVGQYVGIVPGNYWERGLVNVVTTVADMLGNANSPIADPEDYPIINPAYNGEVHGTRYLTWDEIKDWNEGPVQNVLNGIHADLVNEIDLDLAQDVIEVPVIFIPEEHLYNHNINVVLGQHPLTVAPGQPGAYLAGALTADMVNMLVANKMLVVPQAFGPETIAGDEFQLYLTQQITAANNTLRVRYIDDWNLYHAKLGEVHCGTNTLRKPANMNTWLGSPAAKWWNFPG